jgi:hypothetical protein
VQSKTLCLRLGNVKGFDSLSIGFISIDGLTYKKRIKIDDNIIRIPLDDIQLVPTILQPQAYPAFLPDYFTPNHSVPLKNGEFEFLEISTGKGAVVQEYILELECAWLE